MPFPFLGTISDLIEGENCIHALVATANIWFRIDGMLDPAKGVITATFTANFADGSVLRGAVHDSAADHRGLSS